MAHDPLAAVNTALAGKYVAEGEIGKGGAARVYRAHDKSGRIVALKALHPELLVSSAADRFLQEVRMAGELDHPHIVPLLDSGTAGWLVYYVMPYVEGPSLRQSIDQRGPLPATEVMAIARDVLDALEHAHQRGLVHRDIKPDNILISP
ncbi:MAG TPA: serine/threonine-protein kinase, partial [Gemmatimonadales bacterium]|nr:serine/threonine-protein kinase [Gemmatimonadales bacterium]